MGLQLVYLLGYYGARFASLLRAFAGTLVGVFATDVLLGSVVGMDDFDVVVRTEADPEPSD
jgi:hypothetical protein